jgi:hypothetical protein
LRRTPAARLSKLSPDGRPPAFGACTGSEMSPVILRCPRVTSADLGQRLVRARASKDERPRLGPSPFEARTPPRLRRLRRLDCVLAPQGDGARVCLWLRRSLSFRGAPQTPSLRSGPGMTPLAWQKAERRQRGRAEEAAYARFNRRRSSGAARPSRSGPLRSRRPRNGGRCPGRSPGSTDRRSP